MSTTYHRWRGDGTGKYEDAPGFCKSASTEEIAAADEPFEEKMARLGAKLEKAIRENLRKPGYGG